MTVSRHFRHEGFQALQTFGMAMAVSLGWIELKSQFTLEIHAGVSAFGI